MQEPDPEEFVEKQEVRDFSNILSHLYRGEIQRANTWRTRLDTTTNWAVIILSALTTWTFSVPSRRHELLLFTLLFMVILMMIEARRYLVYNVWASRVKVLEENFIAKTLTPSKEVTSREWMKTLSRDLKKPRFKLPYFAAVSHRLRRIYIWFFSVNIGLWIAKLALHPFVISDFSTIVSRADIGGISGVSVMITIGIFYLVSLIITLIGPKFENRMSKIGFDKRYRKEWEKKM
ncbi:MAG: DUF2270 domain-containing protein [Thermoplasmata archaeon]